MYKKGKLFCWLFMTTGMCACSATHKGRVNGGGEGLFPVVVQPVETKLMDAGLSSPQLMTIYKDSLLLVVNNLNQNPHHMRVYDIGGKKVANNLFPVGGAKGGTLSFMSFGISDSLVWVFDVAKNGFIVADPGAVLKANAGTFYYAEYRIRPQVFYYDAKLLSRHEALLSGNYDTDEKLTYVDFRDSTRNKLLLSYKQDSAIRVSRVKKMSYESFMVLKPDQSKVLLAGRYTDRLELLDLRNGQYKNVLGPAGFAPDLDPFENNAGNMDATPNQQTRHGFLKGHATEQYIYLLFSGHPYRSWHRFYGNTILVYDWEGNPVKKIVLKNDIVTFSVSSNDKWLYTLNSQTGVISFAAL